VSSLAIGWIVFTCVFGGAVLGALLRSILPDHHLNADSKDVLKLAMGLTGTMAALVLSLLIGSAKSAYDTRSNEVMQASANIMLLDRLLAHYGPETRDIRDTLRRGVGGTIDRIWSPPGSGSGQFEITGGTEVLLDRIGQLSPQTEAQRALQAQVRALTFSLGQTRWLLAGQHDDWALPMPFLAVLVFWLTIIFGAFGLFTRPNTTIAVVLFVCALSFASAIFLIVELSRPFGGFLQISSAPLQDALSQLGR